MTGLITYNGQNSQAALPVAIDYPAALALRQMALIHDELPKYLLAPEVSALLHYVPDLHRKMLLATLWNTGARINEALALTRGFFAGAAISVRAAGHAQAAHRESGGTAGRAPQAVRSIVWFPFRSPLRQSTADDGGHPENSSRKTKQAHRQNGEGAYLGDHRPYRSHRLSEAVEAAAADGVTFSVPVSPHTFRHSYAMHMLYAGIPLKVLQSLMGHKSISSTEVYTKVFALDVAARHRVQFAMPEADAVAMLKGNI